MAGETRVVAGDGSGYYNCDGVADDVEINQALAWAAANPGNIVYLKGPFTYDILAQLKIGSSTTFTGDSTACLRLNNSCMWASMVSVIGQYGGTGTITTGVEIYGFEIDCNESHLYHDGVGSPERIHGKGYYNAIHIQGQSTNRAADIHIHDMKIHDSMGDGVRLTYCKNIRVHDCTMYNLEHCSVFCIDSTDIDICDNDIQAITCAGVRLDNSQDWSVHDNNIRDWTGTTNAYKLGEFGVQFGNEPISYGHTTLTKNGKVYNNIISVGGCGIQIEDYLKTAGASAQTVYIHNNTITGGNTNWDSYFSGISIYSWGNGLTIEKNTITGSARAGVLVTSAIASGVTAIIKSNNIINTVKAGTDGGYGIWNKASSRMTISAEGNYLTGNVAGSYKYVTPVSESTSYITDAIPDGGTDVDDPDEPVDPTDPANSIYVPATASIIDDDNNYDFERIEKAAYINGVRFKYIGYSNTGGKTIGQSKSPSTSGYNLTDFDFEGSTVTFKCVAKTPEERDRVIAAFYKKGRTAIDLGGVFDGYRITGTGANHDSKFGFETDNPSKAYIYTLTFINELPYRTKIYPRVRGRYIYNSMQFNSDDLYAGNLAKNSSFENWTANSTLDWTLQTSANDNAWENTKYSDELDQFCAVASAGTANTLVQISSNGKSWAVPSGLTNATNCNNAWKTHVWCPDWEMWVAFSVSGLAGYACMSSSDGDTWAEKATPSGADSNAWSSSLWIPGDDPTVFILVSTEGDVWVSDEGDAWTVTSGTSVLDHGRVIAFASSGTNRVMYSDDQCESFIMLTSADETAEWIDSAYAPELQRIVVVAYTGQVMYSDTGGESWAPSTAPNQKWTGVDWNATWGMFVACSEDGTQQIMVSPTGLSGSWELQDTPYASSTQTTSGGEVVRTLAADTPTGYNYTTKATSYSGSDGYASLMYTFTLPPLYNGRIYRIDNIHCSIRAVYAGPWAKMQITVQAASINSGAEQIIAEFGTKQTDYRRRTLDLAIESATNEQVTIRYYLKTSNASIRAGATHIGYTASEMTTSGSSITYTRNAWRDITSAKELGICVVVANSGTGNRVMYAPNYQNWLSGTSAADNNWESICYAGEINTFAAVGTSGTGNRVMIAEGYGTLKDVAPDSWTLETIGQSRSDEYAIDGLYSLQIEGNGLEEPGKITQVIPFDSYYDSGEMYVLAGSGKVSGLTSGSFRVDVYAGGTIVKELTWDADTDWIQKKIQFKFDTVPSRVYARIHGSGTPNTGATFNFDDFIVEKKTDYENGQKGLEIITDGKCNTVPDVILRGVSMDTSSPSTDRKISDETISEDVFDTLTTTYKLVNTFTLPALANGSTYRLDELSCYIKSSNGLAYAYLKITVQAASLFSGKETAIAAWTTNQISGYKHWVYTLPYDLQSATNEVVTLRYYLKVSKTPYRAYAYKLGYKCTVSIDEAVAVANDIYMYNTADPRRILHCCTSLPPGYMTKIRGDNMGSYRYIEPFETGAYASNAYSISGAIARNEENNSLVMPAGSSIVFPFSTLYPVTGIPFVKLYTISGNPQISIADDSGTNGAPGTFYQVDSNTSAALENAEIQRELDNITNMRLRGKTKYYMKITPVSGQSCEFTQMLEYASLDTMDAQRFFIYATGKANTLAVIVEDVDKCSVAALLSYRDADILP